eukprot:CAMPEP_0194450076 /NCGR_PEP_ID=MMETSP0176-20130528/130506_1 /TAXON_ID=216777 /ORGANISM="Proboscia alata, Strain PI-D3" /LENGTH=492 /DNA_ID=CAMNT_0039277291 /DNA_START=442 /DNA_END=1921 /DNA_ORIENTATION=-
MTKDYAKVFCYWPVWIFAGPLIFVADVKCVRQVLTDVKTFTKGPDYTVRFAAALGNGMVTSVGDVHRRQRACVLRFFQKKTIDTYVPIFESKTIESMVDMDLVKVQPDGSIQTNLGVKDNFDIDLWVHLITIRVIAQICLGYDSSVDTAYEREGMVDIAFGQQVVGNRIFFKMPIFNFDPSIRKLRKKLDKMYGVLGDVIDKRNVTYRNNDATKDKEPDDILKALLDSGCDPQEVLEQLTTIVFAGFETTATFLSYALYRIAKHPEVQERIRAEMREVIGDVGTINNYVFAGFETTATFLSYALYRIAKHPEVQERLRAEMREVIGDKTEISHEDLNNLKYLACVLKESMRYSSVIPLVSREVTKDSVLTLSDGSKQKILKGSNLFVCFYLLNMDSEIWDEPKKFKPERMEDIKDLQSVKHGFLPFSYGVRSCVGNVFAFVEGQMAVVHLLQHFKLEPQEGFRPKAKIGISTVLKNGMRIKMVPIVKNDTSI